MRLLFAGSPVIAVPSLELLHDAGYVGAVLTSPDAPRGRSRTPLPSPVGEAAARLGLPVLKPERLGAEARRETAAGSFDLLAVFAYGKIFGPRFLELFPRGGINLHPSLLPLHRGPAPLQATILAGDERWGLTVQRIALEMDAGDILLQRSYPCTMNETAGGLSERAAALGAEALLETVRRLEEGSEEAVPQDHSRASYCHLLTKEEGRIDWERPAVEIERMIRAFDPWPGAWTLFGEQKLSIPEAALPPSDLESEILAGEAPSPGKIVAVDKRHGILVQTGAGLLALRALQLQGKKRLDWRSFLNGVRGFEAAPLGGTQ